MPFCIACIMPILILKKTLIHPNILKNIFSMMHHTARVYSDINRRRVTVEERFEKNLPSWEALDRWGQTAISRILWLGIYVTFFIIFADHWWLYLFLPVVVLMSP